MGINLDGRGRRDPWSEVHYAQLERVKDGRKFYFAASSFGGRKAIGQIARGASQRPGEIPIVRLGVDSYEHKVFGTVLTPVFEATWTKDPEAPKQPERLSSALDDDIPF